jgi:alkylation response protein AidB-like acyl-CoA dehydrogenase
MSVKGLVLDVTRQPQLSRLGRHVGQGWVVVAFGHKIYMTGRSVHDWWFSFALDGLPQSFHVPQRYDTCRQSYEGGSAHRLLLIL